MVALWMNGLVCELGVLDLLVVVVVLFVTHALPLFGPWVLCEPLMVEMLRAIFAYLINFFDLGGMLITSPVTHLCNINNLKKNSIIAP